MPDRTFSSNAGLILCHVTRQAIHFGLKRTTQIESQISLNCIQRFCASIGRTQIVCTKINPSRLKNFLQRLRAVVKEMSGAWRIFAAISLQAEQSLWRYHFARHHLCHSLPGFDDGWTSQIAIEVQASYGERKYPRASLA
jgi:hypothetical protein